LKQFFSPDTQATLIQGQMLPLAISASVIILFAACAIHAGDSSRL